MGTKRIVADFGYCGGKPRIAGTRIQVSLILEILGSGGTKNEILEIYPHLAIDDIRACLQFAGELVAKVDVKIDDNSSIEILSG